MGALAEAFAELQAVAGVLPALADVTGINPGLDRHTLRSAVSAASPALAATLELSVFPARPNILVGQIGYLTAAFAKLHRAKAA